ncbi:transmembrane and ubiquitin-like domain-containing protein 1 [Artemia franciscana]|uniref:transmembrane and ubiquitin-like domain-containing protein 1 n=1 Tax=Artemia franciscana TaxID=6661 RepID=UPI0032DA30CF
MSLEGTEVVVVPLIEISLVLSLVFCALLVFLWKSTEVPALPRQIRIVVSAVGSVGSGQIHVLSVFRGVTVEVPPTVSNRMESDSNINVNSGSSVLQAPQQDHVRRPDDQEVPSNISNSPGSSDGLSEPVIEDGEITVKVRFLDDTLKIVKARKTLSVRDFKILHFPEASDSTKIVKLIFNGKVLSNDAQTLGDCRVFDNCVLHCLIHQNNNVQDNSNLVNNPEVSSTNEAERPGLRHLYRNVRRNAELDVDMGHLLMPFLVALMSALWLTCYFSPESFDFMGLVLLFTISIIFLFISCIFYLA